MTKVELTLAAAEAERLLNENPSWSYKKIINKIKGMMNHGPKTKDRAN